jgi:hypothetical protein
MVVMKPALLKRKVGNQAFRALIDSPYAVSSMNAHT